MTTDPEPNINKHSSNLFCSWFFIEHSFYLLIFFQTYELFDVFQGFISHHQIFIFSDSNDKTKHAHIYLISKRLFLYQPPSSV